MDITIRLLIPAIISIAIGALSFHIMKTNDKELIANLKKEHIIIRLPKAYLWVGCIGFLGSSTLCILILLSSEAKKIFTGSMCGAFILLFQVIVLGTLIWKIEIFKDQDYFIYRNIFGKKYKIRYDECKCYKDGLNTFTLYAIGKRFFIDNKATNFYFLYSMLNKHKVKKIIPKKK